MTDESSSQITPTLYPMELLTLLDHMYYDIILGHYFYGGQAPPPHAKFSQLFFLATNSKGMMYNWR
jgi:hypothetical protein